MKKLITIIALFISVNGYAQTQEQKTNSLVFLAYTTAFNGTVAYLAHRTDNAPKSLIYFNVAVPVVFLGHATNMHRKEIKYAYLSVRSTIKSWRRNENR